MSTPGFGELVGAFHVMNGSHSFWLVFIMNSALSVAIQFISESYLTVTETNRGLA